MAQGDAWNYGDVGSVAGGAETEVTITAASGNHIAVHNGAYSIDDHGTKGAFTVSGYDGSVPEEWGYNNTNTNQTTAWVHDSGPGNDTFHNRHGWTKVFIDDTIGLQVNLENSTCSSLNYTYHMTGQQVK